MAAPLCVTGQLAADVQRSLLECLTIGVCHIFELLKE